MPVYLAEFFLPRTAGSTPASLARQVERTASPAGSVRFVRAVALPAQEFCLCLFEADDDAAVTRAAAAAGLALTTRPEPVELYEALHHLDDHAVRAGPPREETR